MPSNFWTYLTTCDSETEVLKLLYSFRFQKVNGCVERLAGHQDLTSIPPTVQFYFGPAWPEYLVALGEHLVLFSSTLYFILKDLHAPRLFCKGNQSVRSDWEMSFRNTLLTKLKCQCGFMLNMLDDLWGNLFVCMRKWRLGGQEDMSHEQ